ncbi:hypothetical protein [Mucilaginibacter kameinonensis]|uniref:hypothetical protein n=1 Tax=Mucilaginibacter kameinonensis TaxID=452286 RepID=UPI000EF7A62D|nr:hypothetical protein [Mucilaginibacter kameinonensis]
MKQFYTLLFTFFLLSFYHASAQTNYKQGFVITSNGEPINGFINYREWYSNPDNISFKKTLDGKVQNYHPTDISYFEIAGIEQYQSAMVAISMGKTDIQTVGNEIDTTSKTDQVFLKIVQKGANVSLLSYTDAIKTRFYVTDNKTGIAPQELKYQPYLDRDSPSLKKKNIYYAQLIELANKYRQDNARAVIDRIVILNYNEDEILKVINLINNDNTATVKKSNAHAYSLYAGVGLNASRVTRQGNPPTGTTDLQKSSYLPELIFGVDVPFNPNTGRLIFRTELVLEMIKARVSNYDVEYSSTTIRTYSFTQTSASLRPQLVYNFFNGNNFKFYLGGGAAINFSRYSAANTKKQMSSATVPGFNSVSEEKVPSSGGAWFTPIAKAGFIVGKKFDLSFGYSPSTGIAAAANILGISVTTVEAGVNYHF